MAGDVFTRVTISLEDDALDRIDEVHRHLVRAGLQSSAVQEGIGTVTGTVREAAIAQLEQVPGVAAVERGRTATVPDPGSDLQ
jgi:hypothetical protein